MGALQQKCMQYILVWQQTCRTLYYHILLLKCDNRWVKLKNGYFAQEMYVIYFCMTTNVIDVEHYIVNFTFKSVNIDVWN